LITRNDAHMTIMSIERAQTTQSEHPRVRSHPFECWPVADREAWLASCRSGARLKRSGNASHFKPIAQRDLARRYGYLLDHLDRHGLLDPEAQAGTHVTPQNIEAFLTELRSRVGSVTLYGTTYKVRRTAQLVAPHLDFRWLTEIEKDLASTMQPRGKNDRLVLAEVLVEAGLTLIAEAEDSPDLTRLRRARGVRNGLMIALLGFCPIRLKNFAALEIGRTFVQIKGSWWIVLPSSETKERRADERRVDDALTPTIESYLAVYRSVLARAGNDSRALWLSSNDGVAMSYCGVERVVTQTTRSAIGVDISPHMFRTSAASTAAIYSAENPNLGSALLNHSNPTVTQEHYNRASGISASQALAAVIDGYRELSEALGPSVDLQNDKVIERRRTRPAGLSAIG
jgi:integrase